jgi:(5-formylfuran-3-yl)methyl phosphate synthase
VQLLVSVRSAEEVEPALLGGADIIDAKEPERGSLGAVDRTALDEINHRLPLERALSVALGDVASVEDVAAALHDRESLERTSPIYLKLGFAGVQSESQIELLLESAVAIASTISPVLRIVAVAYADFDRALTVTPRSMPRLAEASGAAGVLLDTHAKAEGGLLHWIKAEALIDWVIESRQRNLLTALAGGLDQASLARACQAEPDVIGIRTAACEGGRVGRVSRERVAQFREAMIWAVQPVRLHGSPEGWRNA